VAKKNQDNPEEVEIRRAPKVLAFALTGAALGVLLAFGLNLLIPDATRSNANVLGLLLVALGSLGLGLGVAFAIALDLISSRRTKRAVVNRVSQ
jgi:ABC-type antimicrobial peptide transport system permease subunit